MDDAPSSAAAAFPFQDIDLLPIATSLYVSIWLLSNVTLDNTSALLQNIFLFFPSSNAHDFYVRFMTLKSRDILVFV